MILPANQPSPKPSLLIKMQLFFLIHSYTYVVSISPVFKIQCWALSVKKSAKFKRTPFWLVHKWIQPGIIVKVQLACLIQKVHAVLCDMVISVCFSLWSIKIREVLLQQKAYSQQRAFASYGGPTFNIISHITW